MTESVTDAWEKAMAKRAQRLIDDPCTGCGKHAGEKKDEFWRMCEGCSFGWVWLGHPPPLLPDYGRDP